MSIVSLVIAPYIAINSESGHKTEMQSIEMNEITSKPIQTIASGLAAADLGATISKKLSSGLELSITENGIESQLLNFIESDQAVDKTTWFNFSNLNFETGSSKLDEASISEVKNIAEILKANSNVNIKVGGYTDNTGNVASNLKLSGERAAAVKAALVGLGVVDTRLESEGYGQEHAIASNDTEEGKAQNRRISVRVTKK